MVLGAIGGILGGAGLISGIIEGDKARSDAREARSLNERNIARALGFLGEGYDELVSQQGLASTYLDDLLERAGSLEQDLLGQIDPVTSREMRRIQQERQMAEANMTQQLAQRGLDSFTTRMGQQANIRGQAQNAISELGARMAAQRTAAIGAGRQAEMGALGTVAQMQAQFGESRASNFAQRAQLLGGVQYQAPQNTGGLGTSLMNLGMSSILYDAMNQAGPGNSAKGTPPAPGPAGLGGNNR